jgi:hypothetical protein
MCRAEGLMEQGFGALGVHFTIIIRALARYLARKYGKHGRKNGGGRKSVVKAAQDKYLTILGVYICTRRVHRSQHESNLQSSIP